MLLITLVAVVGVGVWQIYRLQQSLQATQVDLQQARSSLEKLTGDVSATGATINQSGTTFRSELKTVDSEIRKLWDVSNKRNRGWINDNKGRIEQNSKKLEYTASSAEKAIEMAEAGAKLTALSRKNTDSMQAKLSEVDQLLKAITTEQLVSNSDMTQKLESLSGLVDEQQQLNTQVRSYVDKQVEFNKNFDLYRNQTNRRLQQLENSLRELTKAGQQEGLTVQ